MGVFEHFPYTNFHDLNLDKILERTLEAEEAVEASAQQVQDAADDMAAAQAAAANAVTTANSAVATANNAITAANSAATTADNAITIANSAIAAAVHYYEFSVNSGGTLSPAGNSLTASKRIMINDFVAGRGIMKIVDARHNITAMVTPAIYGLLPISPVTEELDDIGLRAYYQVATNLICFAQVTIDLDAITGGPVIEIQL